MSTSLRRQRASRGMPTRRDVIGRDHWHARAGGVCSQWQTAVSVQTDEIVSAARIPQRAFFLRKSKLCLDRRSFRSAYTALLLDLRGKRERAAANTASKGGAHASNPLQSTYERLARQSVFIYRETLRLAQNRRSLDHILKFLDSAGPRVGSKLIQGFLLMPDISWV